MTWCAINAGEAHLAGAQEVPASSYTHSTDDSPSATSSQRRAVILDIAERISSIKRKRTRSKRKTPILTKRDSARVLHQKELDGDKTRGHLLQVDSALVEEHKFQDHITVEVHESDTRSDHLPSSASKASSTLIDEFDDEILADWSESELQAMNSMGDCAEILPEKSYTADQELVEEFDDDVFDDVADDVLQTLLETTDGVESQFIRGGSLSADQGFAGTIDRDADHTRQHFEDNEFDDFDETIFDQL